MDLGLCFVALFFFYFVIKISDSWHSKVKEDARMTGVIMFQQAMKQHYDKSNVEVVDNHNHEYQNTHSHEYDTSHIPIEWFMWSDL